MSIETVEYAGETYVDYTELAKKVGLVYKRTVLVHGEVFNVLIWSGYDEREHWNAIKLLEAANQALSDYEGVYTRVIPFKFGGYDVNLVSIKRNETPITEVPLVIQFPPLDDAA